MIIQLDYSYQAHGLWNFMETMEQINEKAVRAKRKTAVSNLRTKIFLNSENTNKNPT